MPLYGQLRSTLDERRVAEYVSGADSKLTVKELLARSPGDARQLLGADNYEKFKQAFQADRATAIAGAETLAPGVADDLAVKVESGLKAGGEPAKVIEDLKADSATSDQQRLQLEQTATLLRITGGNAAFLTLVKRR